MRSRRPGAVRCFVLLGVSMVLACGLAPGGGANAASSSTVVSATVPTATNLVATGCATGTANVTDFGTVQPGSSAVTSADCVLSWGSSNATSMLKVYQAGGAASAAAMWSYGNGSLDTTFDGDSGAGNGIVRVPVGTLDDFARAVAIQPDGKTVVAGTTRVDGANDDIVVTRVNANGALDTSFDGDSGTGNGKVVVSIGAWDRAIDMVLQSDGKIVVTGTTGPDVAMLRLNADGTLDTTFDGPSGTANGKFAISFGAWDDTGYSVALDGDGKLIIGGSREVTLTDQDFLIARFNADGSLDVGFDGDSGTANGVISFDPTSDPYAQGLDVLVDATGRYLLTGGADFGGAADRDFVVTRFLADGRLDTAYATGGIARIDFDDSRDYARGAVLQADGKLVITGEWDAGSNWHIGVARLTTAGLPDPAFGVAGAVDLPLPGVDYGEGRSVMPQDDGKLLLASLTWDADPELVMTRLSAGGALDPTFGTGGHRRLVVGSNLDAYSPPFDMAETADGRIVVVVAAGNSDLDLTMVRFDSSRIASYGSADWSTGSNMFGACLRAVTGSGVTGTWTPHATCAAGNGTHWNAIPTSSADVGAKVAASPTSGTNDATANLRFGFRSAASQPPGTYSARLVFEVVAPNS